MPPKYRGGRGGGEGGGGGGGRGGGGGQRGAPRGGRGGGRGGGPPGDFTQRTPSQAQPSRGGGPPRGRNVGQPPTSPPGRAAVPAGPWAQPSQFPALPAQSPPQTVRSPPQAVQTTHASQAPAQTAQPTPRSRTAVESEDIVVFHFTLFIHVRIFLLVLAMAEKADLSLCSRIISVYPTFQMSKCTSTLSLCPPRTGTPQQRALQPPSGKVLKSKQRLERPTLV
jgi:hypothetical protein